MENRGSIYTNGLWTLPTSARNVKFPTPKRTIPPQGRRVSAPPQKGRR